MENAFVEQLRRVERNKLKPRHQPDDAVMRQADTAAEKQHEQPVFRLEHPAPDEKERYDQKVPENGRAEIQRAHAFLNEDEREQHHGKLKRTTLLQGQKQTGDQDIRTGQRLLEGKAEHEEGHPPQDVERHGRLRSGSPGGGVGPLRKNGASGRGGPGIVDPCWPG